MSKRSASEKIEKDNLSLVMKRLKYIEEKLKKTERSRSRHRRRRGTRILLSSPSPSSSSSRTPSPVRSIPKDQIKDSEDVLEPDSLLAPSPPAPPSPRATSLPRSTTQLQLQPPPSSHGLNSEPNNSQLPIEEELDSTILEILGDDPSTAVVYGSPVHREIASRFEHIVTSGLLKETRKELSTKYLIPSNCMCIGAPKLNAEVKAAMSETLIKRDRAIEARQKQLAVAISCLCQIVTEQLKNKNTDHQLLQKVTDVGKLLCDIQYAESTTRRNFASYSLKKDMKEQLLNNTKIDTYLFGENLPDTLKTAKAVCKSGSDLKPEIKPAKKTSVIMPAPSQKSMNTKNLNWKPPAPARRQPGPQRSRDPASQRNQPGSSSKMSSQGQKTTRRR